MTDGRGATRLRLVAGGAGEIPKPAATVRGRAASCPPGGTTMAWHRAIAEYTVAARGAGRREATIVLYRHYLRHVAGLLRGTPWEVTTRDLERVLGAAGWGPSARKSLRTALVSFYRWAHRCGYVDPDPAADLPTVRVPQGRPRPAPESVVAATLDAAGARERLMIELMAFAGLRAGEVSRIHSRDLVGTTLIVQGKGGKQRDVPLEDLHLVEAIAGARGWVFGNGHGGHLTANHVSKLVASLMPEGWTAHTLRHRFGTRAYEGTRDLLAVSRLLGHASPETTLIYVRLPEDHMRDAVRAAALIGATASRPRPLSLEQAS